MAAMSGELLVMSTRELDRLDVIKQVIEGRIKRREAAALLGLCRKQISRLCQAYERDGAAAVVSQKRGRPSNRKTPGEVEARVVQLVRDLYGDFGPTLAREKLAEMHGIKLGLETIRRMLSKAGVWLPKSQRVARPHQHRARRECLGELVQIDGSDHHWFEERAPSCTLLVFVDDATSRLMELRFVESESTFSYFQATASYLRRHGKPVAFYSDKHSTFRVTRQKDGADVEAITQFARALAELNIDIICANTPQAKGRVERMNLTLQDRLVKELRLQGISDVARANAFVPSFIESFNSKFAKTPRNAHDAHRALDPRDDLEELFCCRDERSMAPDLSVQYQGCVYVVTLSAATKPLAGRRRKVAIHTWPDGRMEIQHNGKVLPYTIPDEFPYPTPSEIVERKQLDAKLKSLREAQSDPGRRYALTKRFPPRKPPKPSRRRAGSRYKVIQEVIRLPATRPAKRDFKDKGERTRYYIRWTRGHAYLHERFFTGQGAHLGTGPFTERYVGRVEDRVARRWERLGQPRLPPPLRGQKLPPFPGRRPPKKATPRSIASTATGPSVPPPSGEERLGLALWWADVMHASEAERIRRQNKDVEEYNERLRQKLFADVAADRTKTAALAKNEPPGKDAGRRPPQLVVTLPFRAPARGRPTATGDSQLGGSRRAAPRPVQSSGSARGRQGSPRYARRPGRP